MWLVAGLPWVVCCGVVHSPLFCGRVLLRVLCCFVWSAVAVVLCLLVWLLVPVVLCCVLLVAVVPLPCLAVALGVLCVAVLCV